MYFSVDLLNSNVKYKTDVSENDAINIFLRNVNQLNIDCILNHLTYNNMKWIHKDYSVKLWCHFTVILHFYLHLWFVSYSNKIILFYCFKRKKTSEAFFTYLLMLNYKNCITNFNYLAVT